MGWASGAMPARPYPLSNAHPASPAHHEALAALLDPFTQDRIVMLFDERSIVGRRCLELGAGGGSVAVWLAGQVGPAGQVVATDVNTDRIPDHPHLKVIAHDLAEGAGALGTGWDLIHARLTLEHLPNRVSLVRDLVAGLNPGGVLLVEDWDTLRVAEMVMDAPDLDAAARYAKVQHTLSRLFSAAGTDRGWARQMHATLVREGLAAVDTVMHATAWTGGSPGSQLVTAVLAQLHDQLIRIGGLTEDELDQVTELLTDPRLVLAGHPLYSTAGRRP